MNASQPAAGPARDEFSAARAGHYRLLALLLARAPEAGTLALVAGLSGDSTPLGQAYAALARAAATAEPGAVEREHFELFVGVGRGELLPYASFYLTGFLNERPLAALRADLAVLGVERAAGNHDPEDHIATLCEVMAALVAGDITPRGTVDERAFFDRHIAPWAAQLFDDLEIASSARFYRTVAAIGRLWIDIEARAFALAA